LLSARTGVAKPIENTNNSENRKGIVQWGKQREGKSRRNLREARGARRIRGGYVGLLRKEFNLKLVELK